MDNIPEDEVDAFLYDEGDGDKESSKEEKDNVNKKKEQNQSISESLDENNNNSNNDEKKSNDVEMTEKDKDTKTESAVSSTFSENEIEEDEEEDEEDSDDSDIEIIMNPEPQEDPKQNKLQFNKPAISKDQAINGLGKSTVDINAPGQYEGQNIYDVDLDSFEEKPWRKPGSDITDYFNYGFNEQTWRAYCLKQKQIREESNLQKRINVYESGSNDQDLGFGEQQPTMGRSGRGGFINENSRMNSNLSSKHKLSTY